MITATVYRRGDRYCGFEISGHAGYADSGEDIICAAVSALSINAVNSIESLTDDQVEAEEGDGYLKCTFPEGLSEAGILLMESMILGIRQTAESVSEETGEPFLKLVFEEEQSC